MINNKAIIPFAPTALPRQLAVLGSTSRHGLFLSWSNRTLPA